MPVLTVLIACYAEAPTEDDLITTGRELFRDTRFSTSGSISCATCHPSGHMDNRRWHFASIHDSTNGQPDSLRTLTLWGIAETGPPYLWDASRTNLEEVTRLYTDTIMGGSATDEEIEALVAYQKSLVFPSNPNRQVDETLSDVQRKGKEVYETIGRCSPCHTLPTGTNGKPKNIGTGGIFKTPGLRSVYLQTAFFHDGRARSLKELVDFYDADTSGRLTQDGFVIDLTEEEKSDLIEFLKTL